jgi:NAD(P)-dependent dehydrogenase (short-subunit alcohol dehydrogenase family)
MATALVTGASRGVGRGGAIGLSAAGFTVFATGRTVESAKLPPDIVRIRCDHTDDGDTAHVFDRIATAGEALAVLVNCAWSGYERMMGDGQYTWTAPFWQQPAHRWSSMMNAGVRAAFVASAAAARLMIPRGGGSS